MNKAFLLGFLAAALVVSKPGKTSTIVSGEKLNPSTGKPIVNRGTKRLSEAELAALIEKHGFENATKAATIANRESGRYSDVSVNTVGMNAAQLQDYWKIKASPEVSVGLWQINLLANAALVPGSTLEEKIEALKDPDTNAEIAFKLSKGGTSWGPWGG